MYDPHVHAESLGLNVIYHPLKTSYGLWVPEKKMILIRPNLSGLIERSVLAHEIVHSEFDDRGNNPKQEARANRLAAQRLIDPKVLQQLLRIYPVNDIVCHELGVTRELLQAYLKAA